LSAVARASSAREGRLSEARESVGEGVASLGESPRTFELFCRVRHIGMGSCLLWWNNV